MDLRIAENREAIRYVMAREIMAMLAQLNPSALDREMVQLRDDVRGLFQDPIPENSPVFTQALQEVLKNEHGVYGELPKRLNSLNETTVRALLQTALDEIKKAKSQGQAKDPGTEVEFKNLMDPGTIQKLAIYLAKLKGESSIYSIANFGATRYPELKEIGNNTGAYLHRSRDVWSTPPVPSSIKDLTEKFNMAILKSTIKEETEKHNAPFRSFQKYYRGEKGIPTGPQTALGKPIDAGYSGVRLASFLGLNSVSYSLLKYNVIDKYLNSFE